MSLYYRGSPPGGQFVYDGASMGCGIIKVHSTEGCLFKNFLIPIKRNILMSV